jgi:hypothetical protein
VVVIVVKMFVTPQSWPQNANDRNRSGEVSNCGQYRGTVERFGIFLTSKKARMLPGFQKIYCGGFNSGALPTVTGFGLLSRNGVIKSAFVAVCVR